MDGGNTLSRLAGSLRKEQAQRKANPPVD
jgi:hypothetical protein